MHGLRFRNTARDLRSEGYTYSEIIKTLDIHLPKSTLATWCSGVKISSAFRDSYKEKKLQRMHLAQVASLKVRKKKKDEYFQSLKRENIIIVKALKNNAAAKLVLAALFLGEGSKNTKGTLVFANSNPGIIRLFLNLLRRCYIVKESSLRCTVQCRADQNTFSLEKFWSHQTKIPPQQFYRSRIDPRSIGKISKFKQYKGVCRIDYLSAHTYHDLTVLANMLE